MATLYAAPIMECFAVTRAAREPANVREMQPQGPAVEPLNLPAGLHAATTRRSSAPMLELASAAKSDKHNARLHAVTLVRRAWLLHLAFAAQQVTLSVAVPAAPRDEVASTTFAVLPVRETATELAPHFHATNYLGCRALNLCCAANEVHCGATSGPAGQFSQ